MAYEPKTWSCGDVITADDLNHIEHGIEEASQGGGSSLKYVKDDQTDKGGVIEGLVSNLLYEEINIASGANAHAEGGTSFESEGVICYRPTKALGIASHAEGSGTVASGNYSHAEGNESNARGDYSHAEGDSDANGEYSHAEGDSDANGEYSHAEGRSSANGSSSHSEGRATYAGGDCSHAEGFGTHTHSRSQHTFGEYNISDGDSSSSAVRGQYVEIVGNGTIDRPSNARTLDWDGNEWLAGKLTVGADPTSDMDVATKKYVDSKFDAIDLGYECEDKESITFFDGSVTTRGQAPSISGGFSSPSLVQQDSTIDRITFDGTTYTNVACSTIPQSNYYYYGGEPNTQTGEVDFGEYPFSIIYEKGQSAMPTIFTETAGTYTLKIENDARTEVTTSECFDASVGESIKKNGELALGSTILTEAQLQALLALLNA